tara:strand:+ start:90 stop:1499 length:1410 start_codon:yes stop_codon:yes gene_type:complete
MAEWICHEPGKLNPHLAVLHEDLVSFVATGQGFHPLTGVGAAICTATQPDILRGTKSSLIKAVVLESYILEGTEARSFNLQLSSEYTGEKASQSALQDRVQVLFVRVPELTVLRDPFCSDFDGDIDELYSVIEMHPTAVVPNWTASTPSVLPGSIIEFEYTDVNYSHGIVKRILKLATSYPSMKNMTSGKNAFVNANAGTFLSAGTKIQPENWKKIFEYILYGHKSKNSKGEQNHGQRRWVVKKKYQPQKILDVPSDLQRFMHANGRKDVKVVTNGNTRSLKKTLLGGGDRSKNSLHLFGMAMDLSIYTEEVPQQSPAMKLEVRNGLLMKDHGLLRLLKNFGVQTGLQWGGLFARGGKHSIPAGDGMDEFNAWDAEVHHYELVKSELISMMHPDVKGALLKAGYVPSDMANTSGGGRRTAMYVTIGDELPIQSEADRLATTEAVAAANAAADAITASNMNDHESENPSI